MNSNPIEPATTVPSLNALCSAVYNVLLLQYMMVCYRTSPSYYLPLPPPEFEYVLPLDQRQIEKEQRNVLKILGDAYMNMQFMLADDVATEREKILVQSHAALTYLKKWLPEIKLETIVRMHVPADMTHKDHVYLVKECNGHTSYNSDFLMFTCAEDMHRFQEYKSK